MKNFMALLLFITICKHIQNFTIDSTIIKFGHRESGDQLCMNYTYYILPNRLVSSFNLTPESGFKKRLTYLEVTYMNFVKDIDVVYYPKTLTLTFFNRFPIYLTAFNVTAYAMPE
ncbi:hypothetical protein evm_003018 [Chilo suppressalis]|nr:hypothetical protein evm_003018 [Chilo suppressalis]